MTAFIRSVVISASLAAGWLLAAGDLAVAAENSVAPPTTSLLEQAEHDARESRFFGQSGLQRRSNAAFQRARDPSTYSSGRFSPASLRDHEYGRIKKGPEDALKLRSLTQYYGNRLGRAPAQRSGFDSPFLAPNAGSDPSDPLASGVASARANLGDPAERMRLAAELNTAGFAFDWREHSLQELDGMAGRIATAERLRQRGLDVDWSNHSGEQLNELAARAAHAEQLMQQGRRVDWTGFMRLAPVSPNYGPMAPPAISTPPAPNGALPYRPTSAAPPALPPRF